MRSSSQKILKYIIPSVIIILLGAVVLPDIIYGSVCKVTTVAVGVKDVTRQISLTGKVISSNDSDVCSSIDCKIKKMLVKEGDYLKKGDKIAEIDMDFTKSQLLLLSPPDYDSLKKVEKYITAENDGRITNIIAVDGCLATADNAICTMIVTSGLKVNATVDESRAAEIKAGQTVFFTCAANEKKYTGEIESVSAVAQVSTSGTNSLSAVISVNNADSGIKCGYTANVSVCVQTLRNAVCLPQECVTEINGNEYVYVYKKNKATRQHITTDFYVDNIAVIRDGISKTDVIVDNPERLKNLGDSVYAVALSDGEK